MFKFIEHTADMGIEARASSREAVVEQMAEGLACMMFGEKSHDSAIIKELDVQAEDPVELLVCWLNEIIYISERDNLVPASFRVERYNSHQLRGVMAGETFDSAQHRVERQVKSVTYHQACLLRQRRDWYARVYVDL